jgi:large subunit ribosomal protein L23
MVKLTDAEKKQAAIEKAPVEVHEHESKINETKAKEVKSAKAKEAAKEAKPKQEEKALKSTATLHDLEVLLYPLVTEKAVNMIEAENKITFVVNDNTNKTEIKKVLQEAYGVKVEKINVIRDMKGRKKAIIRLDKKFKASELATKLGVL